MAKLSFPDVTAPEYPLKETFEDNLIKSSMENGVVKTRPRFTKVRRSFELEWSLLDNDSKDALEQFFLVKTKCLASINFLVSCTILNICRLLVCRQPRQRRCTRIVIICWTILSYHAISLLVNANYVYLIWTTARDAGAEVQVCVGQIAAVCSNPYIAPPRSDECAYILPAINMYHITHLDFPQSIKLLSGVV